MTNHHFGKVLVADDEPANVDVVARLVKRLGCDVATAADGQAALDAVYREQPDLVLLDVNMPHLNGFDVCRTLKHNPLTRLLPVVLITGLSAADDRIRGIDAGADNVLSKPFVAAELEARVRSLVQLKRHTDGLDSAALGLWLGLDRAQCRALYRGGFLHDLGKIGIADAILLEPGLLSPAEFATMQQHTIVGDHLCGQLRSLEDVRPIVRHHHERADGSGYPDGLRGSQIPLYARIVAVVDAYDAMTTDRPYKRALQPQQAFDELWQDVTRGWKDASLVAGFVSMMTARAMVNGETGP